MPNITCIIVEDEKPAQEVLHRYIRQIDWLTVQATFEDALAAMEYLKSNEVDLMFLDIQIPALSGIEFLKILKSPPQVIITTAFAEYAVDAFELDVRDYLKKPFSFDRFVKSINRISPPPEISQVHHFSERKTQGESFAFFNVNKTMVRVAFDEILYVESMREYIYLHTSTGKIVTKISTHEIEEILRPQFLRIHRSFIVNINKVTAFTAEDVFVGSTPLPIGVSYKKQLEEVFKRHLIHERKLGQEN